MIIKKRKNPKTRPIYYDKWVRKYAYLPTKLYKGDWIWLQEYEIKMIAGMLGHWLAKREIKQKKY